MLMTRSNGSRRRKLMKGSSNSKGKTFDQEGSTIYLIVMEPLNLTSPTILLPYGTSEDETKNLMII